MKLPIPGWLAFALLGINGYAVAQTLVGSTTDPKGIDGLVVDGTAYNVAFGSHIGPPPPKPFPFPSSDAAAAIASAFNGFGVTELANVSPYTQCAPSDSFCQVNSVLFVAVDSWNAAECCGHVSPWNPVGFYTTYDFGPGGFGPMIYKGIVIGYGYGTTFTAAGVPEPDTFGLMFLGLAGVGFAVRKHKSQERIDPASLDEEDRRRSNRNSP